MARRTLQSLYFADDKDIFDLLSTARQKLTTPRILEVARGRGLILSADEPRERLIEHVARLPISWRQLSALIDATDTAERAERQSSVALTGAFSLEDICTAAEVVRDNRADLRGEVFTIQKFERIVRVTVRYSELDPSKTRLVQRTQRECAFDFERTDRGVHVRHHNQERAREVLEHVIDVLGSKPNEPIEDVRIELSGVADPVLRTDFFLRLIRGLDGFALEDVKAVKAFPSTPKQESLLPPGEDDDLDDESSEAGGAINSDEAEFVSRVKTIALQGEGILATPQYAHITQHGFFVSSIIWTATEGGSSGVRAEFEASFAEPEAGTGFQYSVRKVWERATSGDFKKGKIAPEKIEKTRLVRLVEGAARKSLDAVAQLAATAPEESE